MHLSSSECILLSTSNWTTCLEASLVLINPCLNLWLNGRMTSGIVYSILMHFLIITAYTILISQLFGLTSDQFFKDPLSFVRDWLMLPCFWYCGYELVLRKLDRRLVHFCHSLLYMFIYTTCLAPYNPTKALNCFYVGGALMCWTFFVSIAFVIHLAFRETMDPPKSLPITPIETFMYIFMIKLFLVYFKY